MMKDDPGRSSPGTAAESMPLRKPHSRDEDMINIPEKVRSRDPSGLNTQEKRL